MGGITSMEKEVSAEALGWDWLVYFRVGGLLTVKPVWKPALRG
jgi:hypothetical protein